MSQHAHHSAHLCLLLQPSRCDSSLVSSPSRLGSLGPAHSSSAGAAESGSGSRTLIVACFSGGGSALLVQPAEGLTLQDLQETGELLLASGADIMITTPDRLLRLHARGDLSLRSVRHVVVDEADDMVRYSRQ